MNNTKINLFVPCFIDQFFPLIANNTVKILKHLGFYVLINKKQTCCGQPAFNSGYWNETRQLALKFLDDFSVEGYIVSPSASCVGFIKKHYPKLLKTQEEIKKFESLKNRIFELTDFLVNKIKIVDLGAKFEHKITYHDSCTALREYGIKKEPRILLNKVKGLKLIEMKEAETCCGFGGTFSVKFPEVSTAIVEKKISSAIETGAEYIVTTEASCMMNIFGYIEKNHKPIKAIHITDILANF